MRPLGEGSHRMADLDIVAPRRSYALGCCCTEATERHPARLRLHRESHAAFVSFERSRLATWR